MPAFDKQKQVGLMCIHTLFDYNIVGRQPISVFRQSALVSDFIINPAAGCYNFLPGLRHGCFGVSGCFEHAWGTMWLLSTHRNLPPFCNFLYQNSWFLCSDAIILRTSRKLLSAKAIFLAPNAPNVVWRAGSARIRWGALALPRTVSSGREKVEIQKGGERKRKRREGTSKEEAAHP